MTRIVSEPPPANDPEQRARQGDREHAAEAERGIDSRAAVSHERSKDEDGARSGEDEQGHGEVDHECERSKSGPKENATMTSALMRIEHIDIEVLRLRSCELTRRHSKAGVVAL